LPVPWDKDDPRDARVLEDNLERVLRDIALIARLRHPPSIWMAQEWHRQLYKDVRLPIPYYAGEIRDSDSRFPELYGYEVAIGPFLGVGSRLVPKQLASLETTLRHAVTVLDAAIPRGSQPTPDQVKSVVSLCANVHGEWVRIHPFANGNGRTARLWVNWCALRYGLPAFLRVKPRPTGSPYAVAAMQSMSGDHRATTAVLMDMLDRHLSGLSLS
jgi:fido (protein-threonine AMPylation protein)